MASKEAIAAHHAGKFVEILLTNYDAAAAAVDLGVRHFFIGSSTDLSILNGVGDPGRSLAALEARAGELLRISVDEEGGLVQRLNQYTGALPSPRQMASTMSPQQVQNLMYDHGRKIRALGITVDYAPVVDLAGGANISDNAIGSRSFSADPWVVEQYARAYAQGLIDAGITPVLKHFPGHGRANGDSHHATVVTPPLSDMHHADLLPYAQLGHLPGIQIMMGHMIVPELGEPIPTSINPAAYQLLRSGQYGQNAPTFSGVVTTDDLTGMRAITNHHTPEQAVVAAIAAGADRALAASGPVNTASVIEAIRLAILEERIPTEHANWALHRMGWAPQD